MKPLTDTQRQILQDAARQPEGLAVPPPHLPPAPRASVAKALLGAGLLSRVERSDAHDPTLAWRLDGESVLLRLTDAGRQATGVAAPPAAARDGTELASGAMMAAGR